MLHLRDANALLGWAWAKQFRTVIAGWIDTGEDTVQICINRSLVPKSYLDNTALLRIMLRRQWPNIRVSCFQHKRVLVSITISLSPKPLSTMGRIIDSLKTRKRVKRRLVRLPVTYRNNPWFLRNRLRYRYGIETAVYKQGAFLVIQKVDKE